MLSTRLLSVFLGFLAVQVSAQLHDPAPDNCVDPAGFNKCGGNANSAFIGCSSACSSSNTTCVPNCERTFKATGLACWVQSCWNQIPSCYFQDQVLLYLGDPLIVGTTPAPSIPFWPLPDGTAGACQCNLGKMYDVLLIANSTNDPCPAGSDCDCCYQSALYASFYDLCPTGNIDFVDGLTIQTNASLSMLKSPNDCAILRSPSDPNKACPVFGSTPFGAKEYIDPISLPSGFPGTTLTENAGYVTALAVSASTTVMSLPAFVSTITFAPFKALSSTSGSSQSGNPTLSPATAAALSATWTYNPSASGSSAASGSSSTGSGSASSGGSGSGSGSSGTITSAPAATGAGAAGSSGGSASAAATTASKSAASQVQGGIGKLGWAFVLSVAIAVLII